jgi:hypothetical protein
MELNGTTIICLTGEQLKEFALETAKAAMALAKGEAGKTPESAKRYVYGLRGIRELFNVSHVTAQQYKNTFLAEAVMQRGRKIVVDADKAMELYQQHLAAINR